MHTHGTQAGEPAPATQAILAEEALRQFNIQEGEPVGLMMEEPGDELSAARGFLVAVLLAAVFWIGIAVWRILA